MGEPYDHFKQIREIMGDDAKLALVGIGKDGETMIIESEDALEVCTRALLRQYIEECYSELGFNLAAAIEEGQHMLSMVSTEMYAEYEPDEE